MQIPFTQYLRPDARQKSVIIDRPADIELKAQRLIDAGYIFEGEVLQTGECSFTVERRGSDDEPIAMEVVPHGTGVPEAIDRLVRIAADAHEWIQTHEERSCL